MKRNNETKDISVVIITRNREKPLYKTLKKLNNSSNSTPIIVVDNNSTSYKNGDIVKTFKNVRYIRLKNNIGSAGRNIGVKAANTSYIAFCDDDSWWKKDALRKAVGYFDKFPKLGLIQGRIVVHGKKIDPTCLEMAKGNSDEKTKIIPIHGFVACGSIVRKKAFLEAGGFNKKYTLGGEEELLTLDLKRQGWELGYFNDIVAYHSPSSIRNVSSRIQLTARNKLWTAWLRRPVMQAIKVTIIIAGKSLHDKNILIGFINAWGGLGWIIKERKIGAI